MWAQQGADPMWSWDKIESPWLFLLGVVLLTFILMRRWLRYSRRRRKSMRSDKLQRVGKLTSSAEPRSDLPLIDAPAQITRWQVEMHETARDLKAELDSKMSALQALVRMADEAARRLESAAERAQRLGVAECRDTLDEIQRLTDHLSAEAAGAASLEGRLGKLPPLPAAAQGRLPGDEASRATIYTLADEGQSAAEIADSVGAAVGDVELILSARGSDD